MGLKMASRGQPLTTITSPISELLPRWAVVSWDTRRSRVTTSTCTVS